MSNNNYDVLIIGGGAAGLMAGVQCARHGKDTLILEKMDRPARKILITGKGRCNLTNCCSNEDFMRNVQANARFLYSSLNAFSPYDTMDFFENLGVPLKVERGNRVFPVSDFAGDIADALIHAAKDAGCKILTGTAKSLVISQGKVAGVKTTDGQVFSANSVVVATGGKSYPGTGSTGDGYTLARQAGHHVSALTPSLIPIACEGKFCRDMMGLSLKNVTLSVTDNSTGKQVFSQLGEMLFTHFGISGPLVLSASSHMKPVDCAPLEDSSAKSVKPLSNYSLAIDLKPALSYEQLDARILRDFEQFLNKDFINSLSLLLPRKAIPIVAQVSGIPFETKINQITKPERQNLARAIKAFPLVPTEFRPIEEAVVTSGGIDVKEINPKTMESRIVPGLYFVGEVLDVDAYTGGFNLQIAFSTGFACGNSF